MYSVARRWKSGDTSRIICFPSVDWSFRKPYEFSFARNMKTRKHGVKLSPLDMRGLWTQFFRLKTRKGLPALPSDWPGSCGSFSSTAWRACVQREKAQCLNSDHATHTHNDRETTAPSIRSQSVGVVTIRFWWLYNMLDIPKYEYDLLDHPLRGRCPFPI